MGYRRIAVSLICLSGCGNIQDPVLPQTSSWQEATSLAFIRQELSAVSLNGRILLPGGLGKPYGSRSTLRDLSVYDPDSDVWSPGRPLPEARNNAGTTALLGKLYVVGGFNSQGSRRSSSGMGILSTCTLFSGNKLSFNSDHPTRSRHRFPHCPSLCLRWRV